MDFITRMKSWKLIFPLLSESASFSTLSTYLKKKRKEKKRKEKKRKEKNKEQKSINKNKTKNKNE